MLEKRKQEDAEAQPESKRRKFPSLKSAIMEVIRLQSLNDFLEPALEPLVRRVVKEEVDLALRKHLSSTAWTSPEDSQSTNEIKLKLQFLKRVSLPIFTGTCIGGEGCTAIDVALVDSVTEQLVRSGPEASAKVEIVVLEGDFDGDEEDHWTFEEFKNNIVRERDGKKSLLVGDVFLKLKDGVGSASNLSFTDNSSWTRSRRFRLGARVVESSHGNIVKEAMTVPFAVRDHRGESYKKHYPPSLYDEVWRLEKIGKDGAFHKRLVKKNINTVKDFLSLLSSDPSRLRNVLGAGMSSKMWESTVDHALTCQADAHTLAKEAFQNWNEAQSPQLNQSYGVPKNFYDFGSSAIGSSSSKQNLLTSELSEDFDYGPSLDDCYLPDVGRVSLEFDPEDSTYADLRTGSLVSGTNDCMQFLESHCPTQCKNVCTEMDADLHSAVSGFLLSRAAAVALAHRRWRKVFCILKWLSVRKLVAARSKNVHL